MVLAAGSASRFGSDKRRYRLADGRTMLETTLAAYQRVFDEIFLVLKPGDEAWAPRSRGVQFVYAADCALGMGHSLAAGVRAGRHFDFLFIALADMPHVQAPTLRRLKQAMAGRECIIQPIYRETPGHPVGFGRAYFDELEALTGDTGAKGIVAAHPASTRRIAVDDPGTVCDLDRPT